MNSLAPLLFPFLVLGIVLGSDLGVPLLIEYGREEHVMCQSLGLRNCRMVDVDFDVLHDDSLSDVRIGGRVYARTFNDQPDGFRVFESEEGSMGPALLAYYIDQAGIEQVHASLDGGLVIVTSCGEGCHIKGDLPTPTGVNLRQIQQQRNTGKCKNGDRLNFAECYAAKILGKCQMSFYSEVQCEATCGVTCCGDSNFNNCRALVAMRPENIGCAVFGGNNFCRKSCKMCT